MKPIICLKDVSINVKKILFVCLFVCLVVVCVTVYIGDRESKEIYLK